MALIISQVDHCIDETNGSNIFLLALPTIAVREKINLVVAHNTEGTFAAIEP